MTVYVDDMRARFGRMIMCHMIADTDAELRAMADAIGVAQKWHQGDHFDIALSKRAAAIAKGAVPITWRQAGAMAYFARRSEPMGDPGTAVERMLAAKRVAA
jgi:hypothetical protein